MSMISARKKSDRGTDLLLWVSAMRENAEQAGLTMRIVVARPENR
jgi:hypothetical protein